MKYLIDTHILLWSLTDPDKLASNIQQTLLNENNDIFLSQISIWEISLKSSIGKLVLKGMTIEQIELAIQTSYLKIHQLTNEEVFSFSKLPKTQHKDPFYRMLICQAITNDYTFITVDRQINQAEYSGLKVL